MKFGFGCLSFREWKLHQAFPLILRVSEIYSTTFLQDKEKVQETVPLLGISCLTMGNVFSLLC